MDTDFLTQLENTSSAVKALGVMCTTLLDTGDDHRSIAAGIDRLFRRELDDLDRVLDGLTKQEHETRAGALEFKDPAFLAKLTGVPIRTVQSVLWAACGVETARFTDTMLADDDFLYEAFRRKLRDADLVEQARGTVSEWSGVAPEIVGKVLHAAGEAATEIMFRTHKKNREPEALREEEAMLAKLRGTTADRAKLEGEDGEQAARDHQSEKLDAELAGHDPHLSPDEMREKFIADHARRGVSVPQIAEALNMKQAAVSKLVGQLLGEQRKPDNPVSSNKAVNE